VFAPLDGLRLPGLRMLAQVIAPFDSVDTEIAENMLPRWPDFDIHMQNVLAVGQ
jgi:hypothetical protein